MADRFTPEPDIAKRLAALEEPAAYLKRLVVEREQATGDDLIT